MAVNVPKSDKVYTTVYDNFKGVDFTNDATNIYRRRTPDGINMMPNLDGKPYKRTGWEMILDESIFEKVAGKDTDNFEIKSLRYFEINGCDHLAIFTSLGLFIYRQTATEEAPDELILCTEDEWVKESYDRTFFFEANGTSAFYVYGNAQIWRYKWDGEYSFENVSPEIPRLRISVPANGEGGTMLEAMNMLGDMVSEEFRDNIILHVTQTMLPSGVTIKEDIFAYKCGGKGAYRFKYKAETSSWLDKDDMDVLLSSYGIEVASGASLSDGDTISVTVDGNYRTYLLKMIPEDKVDRVKVFTSDSAPNPDGTGGQYGTELTVSGSEIPLSAEHPCRLVTEDDKSYIEYYGEHRTLVDGEDAIRVEYPAVITKVTSFSGSASLKAKAGGK